MVRRLAISVFEASHSVPATGGVKSRPMVVLGHYFLIILKMGLRNFG